MANQDTARQHEIRDEESWLQSAGMEDLYRLVRHCDVSLDEFPVDKTKLCREDLINILKSCRERDLTDAQFRELMKPAITLDVKNAQEQLKDGLKSTRESLMTEIKPLQDFSRRLTISSAIVAGVVGILGSFLINSLMGIGELESSMRDEMKTALKNLGDAKKKLNEAEIDLNVSVKKVSGLETKATKSNQEFQKMIIALSSHTGIQMIGKLNARLDLLRSMKVYHLKPLMKDLALEIESDARTLKSLEQTLNESRPQSDEHQLLVSLGKIGEAIRDLKLIYDEDEKINMANLVKSRNQWSPLHAEVSIVEMKLHTMMGDTDWTSGAGNLPRLKANVYQVEAGLAIQEHRENKDDNGKLLQTARERCTAAIACDPSAPMAHLYDGLISSLRISLMCKQEMDANERIKDVEKAKDRGLESYRSAVRVTASPELKVYALNGAAYLMVKTSNIYVEAAKDPQSSEHKAGYEKAAEDLLASARREIQQAQQAAAAIDPIVLTTQADIEILSLQFEQPADPEQAYTNILGLLELAVSNGYTGFSGPRERFFEERPHFKYLSQFSKDYEDDVCRAVGVQ